MHEPHRPDRPCEPQEIKFSLEIGLSPALQSFLERLIKTDDSAFNRKLNKLLDGLEALAK